jgi:peptide/nickel transport system substrate-binding protein
MSQRFHVIGLLALMLSAAILAGGCGKPGVSSGGSGGEVSYDPRKDPLVNPETLFEAVPEDRSKVDTDATLFLQLDGSPNTLNPLFTSTLYEQTVSGAVYSGLFTFDKKFEWRPNEDLVQPGSFQESEDHTTFTVKLKPGLKWHDGTPFTAQDVVYSWQQILDPDVPAFTVKSGTEPIKECVAVDDLTVKFVQPEPLATAKWNLFFPVIPRHIFAKHKEQHPDLKTGEYYTRQAREPIGNGPWRLLEWKENDQIILERWEDYAGRKPHFKRVVYKIIPDNNVTLLSFEKGDVDAINRMSAQQFARETNTESFRKVGVKGWGTEWGFGYIGWNMDGTNPFFNDKRVRHAMTHALNIPLIIEKVYYNLATQSRGIYHPDSWMFNPEVKPLEYDLEKAAALLDEAGWKVDPGDGYRYRDVEGARVRFEFTLLMPQGSPSAPKIAAIYQQDLKRLGVDMKTRVLEWASFHEKISKHEFQAEIAGWGTGTDPDTGWNLWRTEEYQTGRNYGGYSNQRVDELFVLGRKEFDPEARKKIYQEIHKVLYEDQPYTWIYDSPLLAAFNKRLRGVQFSPRGIYGFDPGSDAWWTPATGHAGPVALRP